MTLCFFFCCSIWSLHLPRRANSLSFDFNFSQPGGYSAQDLSFQGDAYLDSQAQMIFLTRNGASSDIHNSVGRALHAQPVPLWDAVTGKIASFITIFSFQINANSNNTSDGMAFFLGHYPPTSIPEPLDNGRNHGLFNKNASTAATGDDRATAVEFDTFFNAGFDASNGGHMGIDVNSIVSRAYTDVDVTGKNLTSGLPMTCQISYDGGKILAAILQIGDLTYRVNTSVDLSQVLPSVVAIGLSGATGVAVEIHRIMAWSFNSTLDLDTPRPPATKIPWKLVEVTGPVVGVFLLMCICRRSSMAATHEKEEIRGSRQGPSAF